MNLFKIIMLMGTIIALSACGDKDDEDSGDTTGTEDSGS